MNDTIKALEATIVAAQRDLERELGAVQALVDKGEHVQALAEQAARDAVDFEQASLLLAQYADVRQESVLRTIETIASVGLSQVFDEEIQLKIEPVMRARRVEMDVSVITGDLQTPILEARGGGLAAVAGFLLRVCVLLLNPNARKLIVLDEVFAMLSEDYVPRMSEFLRELCELTGLQIILVSHQPEFAQSAHKVIRIEKTGQNTSRLVEEASTYTNEEN